MYRRSQQTFWYYYIMIVWSYFYILSFGSSSLAIKFYHMIYFWVIILILECMAVFLSKLSNIGIRSGARMCIIV